MLFPRFQSFPLNTESFYVSAALKVSVIHHWDTFLLTSLYNNQLFEVDADLHFPLDALSI